MKKSDAFFKARFWHLSRAPGIGLSRTTGIFLLSLLLAAGLSGCSVLRLLNEPWTQPTLPPVDRTYESQPESTTIESGYNTPPAETSKGRTTGESVRPLETTASAASADPSLAPSQIDAFENKVRVLILAGLKNLDREVKLDSALAAVTIPASLSDAVIERVFDIFQDIWFSQPEFYFLSGQAHASYTLLHSSESTLKSLTLRPEFIDSASTETDAAIKKRQQQLLQKAAELAAQAKTAGSQPVERLLYIHDSLVRLIQYDTAAAEIPELNRERSNAASGLLDGLALCQG